MKDLEFRVLGPLEATAGGVALDLGGPRQRAVLGLLLVEANRVVSSDRLIEGVWGERPPASASATVQSYVSRLRKAVGPEALVSAASGYELRVDPDRVDALRLERLAASGHRLLADGDARSAAETLREALGLWRGEPFGDLAYEAWAAPEVARLEEVRLAALEDQVEAELALGRHAELIGELEQLAARHPLRERLRGQLMLALYRCDRQAEALDAYQQARRALVEELGLEPARSLQDLHEAILRQEASLLWAPPQPSGSSLVGRERELALAARALDAALRGHGGVAVITGEAGIGKTRLAEEVAGLARAAGAAVVWGRCWEAGGAPPYWPWTQVLRGYLEGVDANALRERLGPRLPRLAAALPSLQELTGEPSGEYPPPEERFVVFSAMAELLGGESAERPIVIVLDDLHAADEPSLLLLRFLAGELPGRRLLVMAVARAAREHLGDVASRAQLRLDLGGLDDDAVSALVERVTGTRPSDALAYSIRAGSDGNPLFVTELALAQGDAAVRPRIPARDRELIAHRLGDLSAACREALVCASVVGREFDLATLARVVGVELTELLGPVDEAIAARVLADSPDTVGRFRFAHALWRERFYDDLTATERMRLHQRVGDVLERVYAGAMDDHLGELAHHFFQAANAAKAATYAGRAAERALRALAFEEAIRLYQLALRALDTAGATPDRLFADLLGLGEAQARAGEMSAARPTFLRAAQLARDAGDPDRLALAALGFGGRFGWSRQGTVHELVPLLEEALGAIGDSDSALRVRLLSRLAGALRDQTAREPRASISAEAVEVARRLGDPETLAYALETRWHAIWWVENAGERLQIANELVELAARSNDRERVFEAHHARAGCLHELARLDEADAEMDLARRAAEELGQSSHRNIVLSNLALNALRTGRFEEAEALSYHGLALGADSEGAPALVAHWIQMFSLRREQDRLNEIERPFGQVALEFPGRWPLRCMVAHAHALAGRTAEARRGLGELGGGELAALPRDNEWLFALSFLPEVCEAAADDARAAELYELLSPFADRIACDMHDADTGSVRRPLGLLAAQLGRRDEAVAHLEAAVEHNDALGYRPAAAWSRLALGRLLGSEGEALLAAARATAGELGMAALARQLQAASSVFGTYSPS